MSLEAEYWKKKDLTAMNPEEWEALCDGCGKCCLFKFTNPNEEAVRFTNVVCRYMDLESCRCTDYENRHVNVPDCIYLTPKIAKTVSWLPSTCAYRLIARGKDLPWWHPLKSGTPQSVFLAGESVRGKVVSEEDVDPDDMEDMVVDWFK